MKLENDHEIKVKELEVYELSQKRKTETAESKKLEASTKSIKVEQSKLEKVLKDIIKDFEVFELEQQE